jgi:hypothetical protein
MGSELFEVSALERFEHLHIICMLQIARNDGIILCNCIYVLQAGLGGFT